MRQLNLIDEPVTSSANPFADPRPLVKCDACGSANFRDRAIHDCQSTIRECRRCSRFMGFPVWYGVETPPRPAVGPENALSDRRAHLR
jgi:hypothetical protein